MISLTPSHIIQHLYCPRFTWFEHVLKIPQYEERHFKVMKGRKIHELKTVQNKSYLRKRLNTKAKYIDQYLTNDLLRGRIDEILEVNEGYLSPLDYKFAEYKGIVYETYRTQLYCYAWLIEENFGKKVRKGYIVYTRTDNRIEEIPVTEGDIEQVKTHAAEISRIISGNIYPKATKIIKRCVSCTYRNICTK